MSELKYHKGLRQLHPSTKISNTSTYMYVSENMKLLAYQGNCHKVTRWWLDTKVITGIASFI